MVQWRDQLLPWQNEGTTEEDQQGDYRSLGLWTINRDQEKPLWLKGSWEDLRMVFFFSPVPFTRHDFSVREIKSNNWDCKQTSARYLKFTFEVTHFFPPHCFGYGNSLLKTRAHDCWPNPRLLELTWNFQGPSQGLCATLLSYIHGNMPTCVYWTLQNFLKFFFFSRSSTVSYISCTKIKCFQFLLNLMLWCKSCLIRKKGEEKSANLKKCLF